MKYWSVILLFSLAITSNLSEAKKSAARLPISTIDEAWDSENCKHSPVYASVCLSFIDALLAGASEKEFSYFLIPTTMLDADKFEVLTDRSGKPILKDDVVVAVKATLALRNQNAKLETTNLQEYYRQKQILDDRFLAYAVTNPIKVQNYDFTNAKKIILDKFLNKKTEFSMALSFMNKFTTTSTGDPYAQIRSAEFEPEKDWGLGLRKRMIDNKMKIVIVAPNSKMDKLGISVGDEILSIGNIAANADNLASIEEKVEKSQGKRPIRIEIKDETTNKITVVNEKISEQQIPTTNSYEFNIAENKIGTLVINTFADGETCEKTKLVVKKLIKNKISHLIIDLRENPGGLNKEAACVLGLFIGNRKPFMKTVLLENGMNYEYLSKNMKPEDLIGYTTSDQLIPEKMPITVLMSSESASASETIIMAMVEAERGWLVGQRTFGKGIEQDIIPYLYGEGLEMTYTISRYENMHGFSPHLIGIKPDFEVSSSLLNYDGEIMADRFVDIFGKAFGSKNTEMIISAARLAKREQVEQCSKTSLQNKKMSDTTARWLKDQQLRKAVAVSLCSAVSP